MTELIETADTAQDTVLEAVESGEVGDEHPRWHSSVALTTMIMALLAALAALLASWTSSEALLDRTAEIIEESRRQGDLLYVEMLRSRHEILLALGETLDGAELQKVTTFEAKARELEAEASQKERLTLTSNNANQILAIGVTLFSLGITLGGMAIVAERRFLWYIGLLFGVVAVLALGMGIVTMLV